MFYVDIFANELVKEKDKFAAQERYYEYRKGTDDNIIIETYIVEYKPLKVCDFAHEIVTEENKNMINIGRENFFKEHNIIHNPRLYAYTVPPELYEEVITKLYSRGDKI